MKGLEIRWHWLWRKLNSSFKNPMNKISEKVKLTKLSRCGSCWFVPFPFVVQTSVQYLTQNFNNLLIPFIFFFTDLQRYSYIVFYDHDGTSAANVYSHISAIYSNLTAAMTDVSVILGGIDRVKLHFPHLVRYLIWLLQGAVN